MYIEQFILEVLIRDSGIHNKLKKIYIVEEVQKLMEQAGEQPAARNTIERHLDAMITDIFDPDKPREDVLEQNNKPCIYCEGDIEGKKSNYWIENIISDDELRYLLDSVLYSKILSTDQAKNLSSRVIALSGKKFRKHTMYMEKMERQLYIGEADVLRNISLIQEAILSQRKIKFTLNVYKPIYDRGKKKHVVKLVPKAYNPRICSPYDVIVSNGKYYLLASNKKIEQEGAYTTYRIDLMTDVTITKAVAMSKGEAGITDTENLTKHRIENPYMFTGEVRAVKIRVDSEQFTQIVDWFGDNFKIVGESADEKYVDIEVKVNLKGFIYWVLQYSKCVEVLAPRHFREEVKKTINEIAEKYNK